MTLAQLIAILKTAPPDNICPKGFSSPHSYRGSYEYLAFAPTPNTSFRNMLKDAHSAMGATYTGYKGGDFKMDEYTEVYLAEYGCCGEQISTLLIELLIQTSTPPAATQEQKGDV